MSFRNSVTSLLILSSLATLAACNGSDQNILIQENATHPVQAANYYQGKHLRTHIELENSYDFLGLLYRNVLPHAGAPLLKGLSTLNPSWTGTWTHEMGCDNSDGQRSVFGVQPNNGREIKFTNCRLNNLQVDGSAVILNSVNTESSSENASISTTLSFDNLRVEMGGYVSVMAGSMTNTEFATQAERNLVMDVTLADHYSNNFARIDMAIQSAGNSSYGATHNLSGNIYHADRGHVTVKNQSSHLVLSPAAYNGLALGRIRLVGAPYINFNNDEEFSDTELEIAAYPNAFDSTTLNYRLGYYNGTYEVEDETVLPYVSDVNNQSFLSWAGGASPLTAPNTIPDNTNNEDTNTPVVGTNTAPTAIAMAIPSQQSPYLFTLDGTESSDPENNPLTYEWELIGTPPGAGGTVINPSAAEANLSVDSTGTYEVRLTVTDTGGLASYTSIEVIVTQ